MPSWPDEARRRASLLAAAGWNVNRLPAEAFTADLSTDAGLATTAAPTVRRGAGSTARPATDGTTGEAAASLRAAVTEVFGSCEVILTGSGRGAESVVASLVRPGQRVLANEVYVSGRWWVERFGGSVMPLPGPDPADVDTDIDALAYVQLTAPPACLAPGAGRPVPLDTFRSMRAWLDRHAPDVPLVVDASRLWENAAATSTDVEEVIDLADVLVLSAGKDLGRAAGGLVVVRSPAWSARLTSAAAVLEPDDGGLTADEHESLAEGLATASGGEATDRWRDLDDLAHALLERGLPLHSWGAGSIFLDPSAWVPQVPTDELAAQVLLDVIWLLTGWRGLGSTTDDAGVAPLVRLAMRGAGPELLARLPAVAAVAATIRRGFVPLGRDRAAPYWQPAAPVDPTEWPATSGGVASASGPWLVARCRRGVGPQRALADAWTGTFPDTPAPDDDPSLHALIDLLSRRSPDGAISAAGAARGDGVGVPRAGSSRSRPSAPPKIVRLDAPDAWPAARHDGIDVCWASTDAGGLVAVRADSPLAAPLDAGSLFTLGTWFAPEPSQVREPSR